MIRAKAAMHSWIGLPTRSSRDTVTRWRRGSGGPAMVWQKCGITWIGAAGVRSASICVLCTWVEVTMASPLKFSIRKRERGTISPLGPR